MNHFLFIKKYGVFLLIIFAAILFFIINNWRDSNEIEVSDEPLLETDERTPMQKSREGDDEEENERRNEQTTMIFIDVKGAVRKPGVYELPSSSRVFEAIEKAGGMNDQADGNRVNLARKLTDGMVVYVPKLGEKIDENALMDESGANANASQRPQEKEKININTATKEELQNLTGIGPAKAEAIIAHREENGPFQKEEDLLEVTGIGEKTFEKIKNEISVDEHEDLSIN